MKVLKFFFNGLKKEFFYDKSSVKSKVIFSFSLYYIFLFILFVVVDLFLNYELSGFDFDYIFSRLKGIFIYGFLFLFLLRLILNKLLNKYIIQRINTYKYEMYTMINKDNSRRLTIFGTDEVDNLAFYTNNIFDRYEQSLVLEKKHSLLDPLTMCYNRRALELNFDAAQQKAIRTNGRISIVMFDIDNFKKVNDKYGHDVGDIVLKKLGKIIRNLSRKYDTVYRIGGEEFLILLPDISSVDSKKFIERLRKEITYKLRKEVTKINSLITVSGGYVCSKSFELQSDTLLDDMIKRADELLYNAKTSGKNKILYKKSS